MGLMYMIQDKPKGLFTKFCFSVLYSGYLLLDINLITKGHNQVVINAGYKEAAEQAKETNYIFSYGENHLLAVIKLYIDIICIFVAIL